MASKVASTSATLLPEWPPNLSPPQLAALTAQATDYALSHGLIYRPIGSPPPSTHAHHAPISLFPSPFPRAAFQQALHIQAMLNHLYATVAVDDHFLTKVIGDMVAPVDDFTRGLWQVYTQTKRGGDLPKQEPLHVTTGTSIEVFTGQTADFLRTIHLGLFRSDYLLHASSSSETPSIRQVEFNTISSSFGPLCQKVSELHRSLLMQTDYCQLAPEHLTLDRMPRNTALTLLSQGLAQAHKAYLTETAWQGREQDAPRILFVVQNEERNAFDQRWLEFELLHTHGIRSTRKTFTSLISSSSRDVSSGALYLTSGTATETTATKTMEISVVYYRSGYTPSDYTTSEHWELRYRLEVTRAIKCPTVALQLAGAKKVQQVLAEEGVVERFLSHRYSTEAIQALRQTWAELYPLDSSSALGRQGQRLAKEEPSRFVMKPQREGGGNNIYREEIPKALHAMDQRDANRPARAPKEREGYILMELIVPPQGLGNYLIRSPTGSTQSNSTPRRTQEGLQAADCRLSPDVVSELGIYGVALFRSRLPPEEGGQLDQDSYWSLPLPTSPETTTTTTTESAAYLLRTKARESDEGGVAVGFSVLDSVLLV